MVFLQMEDGALRRAAVVDQLQRILQPQGYTLRSIMYPNPATKTVNVVYKLLPTTEEETRILLFGINGRLEWEYVLPGQLKSSVLTIEKAGLNNGMYFVSLVTNGIHREVKLLVFIP